MSGIDSKKDLGAHLVFAGGIVASLDDDVDGVGVDRTGFLGGLLCLAIGEASGGPSEKAVSAHIEHSDEVGGSYEPYGDYETDELTADGDTAAISVDLSGAKQFVRVSVEVDLTGGSSPEVPVSATLVLGGADTTPAALQD